LLKCEILTNKRSRPDGGFVALKINLRLVNRFSSFPFTNQQIDL